MKVYLAGKIAKNDWRHVIFSDLARVEFTNTLPRNGHFIYNGPYFLACDHGCYHGEHTHGRGVNGNTCGEVGDTKSATLKNCLEWIETADMMFVWLDQIDAYGTMAEIGYARALNIPIFLAMHEKFQDVHFSNDTWFIQEMANHVIYKKNAQVAWDMFSEKYGDKKGEAVFSMIHDDNQLRWIRKKVTEFCNRLAYNSSVDRLNTYDRMELAKTFLKETVSIPYRFETALIQSEKFKMDLAKEIDYKIVRGYLKNSTNKSATDLQTWQIQGTGLVYTFDENYRREVKKEFVPKVTDKQIRYIESILAKKGQQLSGMAIERMSLKEASEMIDSLVNKKELPAELAAYAMPNLYVHKKGQVLKKVNEKVKPNITHPFHNFLIRKYEAYNELDFYNEQYFTEAWVEFLIDKLSNEEDYEQLKQEAKTQKSRL